MYVAFSCIIAMISGGTIGRDLGAPSYNTQRSMVSKLGIPKRLLDGVSSRGNREYSGRVKLFKSLKRWYFVARSFGIKTLERGSEKYSL